MAGTHQPSSHLRVGAQRCKLSMLRHVATGTIKSFAWQAHLTHGEYRQDLKSGKWSNMVYMESDAQRLCGRSGLQDVAFLKSESANVMNLPGLMVTYGTPSLAATIDVQTKKGVPTTKSGLNSCRQTAYQASEHMHCVGDGVIQALGLVHSWQGGAGRDTCSSDIAAWSLSRASQAAPQILCTRRVCTG